MYLGGNTRGREPESKMSGRKGKLFIISAPSGCGKTTLCRRLLKRTPGMARSVSYTTRPPRKGETNGRDYIFVSKARFDKEKTAGGFLEWARNFGYYYGTPKKRVRGFLERGRDVLLAIDVKGAMKVKKARPGGVFIFILPPSVADLKKRLKQRKTDNSSEISKRIKVARRELAYAPRYDYCVINDNLARAAEKLARIVAAERNRNR